MKNFLLFLFVLPLFVSCSNEPLEAIDYSAKNDEQINEYLKKNDLTAQKTESGLYYIITQEGTGDAFPTDNSNVTVAYKATFLNGSLLDQSTSTGITVPLKSTINGWREGIKYFKKGGKGMLLIPAHLAYGSFNYGSIPGGSVLIFEIELIEFN
ncbi:FKBP-type peptidyl-prolyl cis-trans isomerase [Flavobacterium sp. RSSA_27]|uniref:FKBP-type peptidyl-prolyl cis-trans isomerase n=1 Tax=Flavobacterium sp. RSSA_27 TaxID=3447667 RepID=UPI003F2F092F